MTNPDETGFPRSDKQLLQNWTLTLSGPADGAPAHSRLLEEGVPAAVPGSVLSVLNDRGIAPDVTVDGHEEELRWMSASSWTYRTRIERRGDGAWNRLVFEGIDTLATIRVDGRIVARTDDMFHSWTVDLGRDDAVGEWTIEVELAPVLETIAEAERRAPLPRADMYEIPYNQIRKMACSFGWDWGPTTITAGLWRPVRLERIPVAAIEEMLLDATWIGDENGEARLHGHVKTIGEAARVDLRVRDESGEILAHSSSLLLDGGLDVDLRVPGAARWDPVHLGAQPLHRVEIDLLDARGCVLDTDARRVGFRRIEIVDEPDGIGRPFEIRVNGRRVWARGFNWIPADVLPERVTPEKTRFLIEEALATGANLLRVWGGGVVESDAFYDACDELGILVWQDFEFACAAYAEDEAQRARVRDEVADAVRRVGHHPSLALWCGCNENLWGRVDWGWEERLGPDGMWGERLYYETIPGELARLDPARPYIPGSPFSPDREAHPNDPTQGTTHHWDTWNQLDYAAFEEKSTRFASEFGWQAPASWPTLVRALGHGPTSGEDADLQRLQKHPEGRAGLARAIADHVPHLPRDGQGWYFATQLVQARALRAAISRFRSLHDTCSGALWWQLDDCWPSLSWSVLDVAGRRKLAWYSAREVMAPRAVLPTAEGVPSGLVAVNDTLVEWTTRARLRFVDAKGETLSMEERLVRIPAGSHLLLEASCQVPREAIGLVVDVEGRRAARWFRPDLDMGTDPAILEILDVERTGESASIRVRSRSLIRDLCLLAELIPALADARAAEQLLLLLPGEEGRLEVRGAGLDGTSDEELLGCLRADVDLRFDGGA